MTRVRCASCGSGELVSFLDLGSTPLADAFPVSPDEHERVYPLRLVVCATCCLVQLRDVVPDADLYNGDYGFHTGASPSSIAYFADYARDALERYGDLAHRLTVEVASNDGTLLRHFAQAGCPSVGVEPASNVARVAQDAGLEVLVAPFGRKAAADIVSAHGYAGLVVANNVAAHVSDLNDFFGGLSALLRSDGRAIIEFQYLGDLLAGNQFDHVYHEHRFYYSLTSFAGVVAPYGLRVEEAIHTPAQGGSLRVTLSKGSPRRVESERWLTRNLWAYQSMQGRVDTIRERLLDLIEQEKRQGRVVAGYGASAKSTTLLNFCGLGDLPFVVDKTPAKIGRYTPGTHIPIVAEGRADTFLLLVWNYLSGVIRRERAFLDGGGRFIVPIPQPTLI